MKASRHRFHFGYLAMVFAVLFAPAQARAACSGYPTGVAANDYVIALATAPTITSKGNAVANGIAGMVVYDTGTNALMVCDGTNWQSVASGAGITDGDKGDITVASSGTVWTVDDDALDFTELSDTLALDASTDIAVDNAEVLSITNTGTGDSLLVNDSAADTTPFVIDAAGNVGVGTATPTAALDVVGTVNLQDTTAATSGVVFQNSNRFLHTFHHSTGASAVPDGQNTFLGVDSGNFTTGATATVAVQSSRNTGLGYSTLKSVTTGYQNTAIGSDGLMNLTNGYFNTSVGASALKLVATGYQNTAVGKGALASIRNSYSNTGIGSNAGAYLADGSTANESSTNSIYIGTATKASAAGVANEIVIGNNAVGQGTNSVVLGHTDVVKTILNGSVGVGTAAPDASALLDVSSTTKGFLPPRMTDTDVAGITAPADGLIAYDTVNDVLKLRANGAWVSLATGAGATPAGSDGSIQFKSGTSLAADATNLHWDDTNDRLGVGTNAPSSDISLGGAAARTIAMERATVADNDGKTLTIQAGGATSGGTNKSGGDLILASGVSTGDGSSNIYLKVAKGYQGSGTTDRNPTNIALTVRGSGTPAVGINFQWPEAPLDMNGYVPAIFRRDGNTASYYTGTLIKLKNSTQNWVDYGAFYAGISSNTAGSESGFIDLQTRNAGTLASRVRVAPNGAVGIGTTTPVSLLNIAGSTSAASWTTAGQGLAVDAATYTDTSSAAAATVTTRAANSFAAPTFASTNAITLTNAATVYIDPPVAGTNTTISNGYGLYVAGKIRATDMTTLNGLNMNSSSITSVKSLSVSNGSNNSQAATISATGSNSGGLQVSATAGPALYASAGQSYFVNKVNIGYTTASSGDASAILEAASTTQGFLPPRMLDTEVAAITTPADGLMAYDTVNDVLKLYANGAWVSLATGAGASAAGSDGSVQFKSGTSLAADAANLHWDDTNNFLGIGTNAPTHALTFPSTTTGAAFYNTADQVTNYERATLGWNTNEFQIKTQGAGTATTTRAVRLLSFNPSGLGAYLTVRGNIANAFHYTHNSSIGNGYVQFTHVGLTASSGNQTYFTINPTVNQSGTASYTAFKIAPTETAVGSGASLLMDIGTAAATKFVVTNAGKLGVGTSTPDEGLVEVKSGTVCVDTDGNDSATSCIASESDARLKKNVADLDVSLDSFMKLRPVSFDWKYDDAEVLKNYPLIKRFAAQPHTIGLIAQEVQKIVPEAIESEMVGEGETKYFQLDYTKLVPVIIKAVQDLKHLFDTHDADIAALKAENAALKSQMEALDARLKAMEEKATATVH